MFHFKNHNKSSDGDRSAASGVASSQPMGAKPGHPGNLNPGQQHQLDKLRSNIQAKGIFAPDRHDDVCRTYARLAHASVSLPACPQVGSACR